MTSRRYMLDTNIASDLLKHPKGQVSQHVRLLGADAVCISIVTAAELRFGAVKRDAPRLTHLVNQLLNEIDVVALELPFDETYAETRADLESRGQPIGPNDLIIAAHARSLGAILVTNNEREMRRVSNLRIENWLA